MFESIYEKSLLLFNRSNCNHVKLADMIYLCYLGGTETKMDLVKVFYVYKRAIQFVPKRTRANLLLKPFLIFDESANLIFAKRALTCGICDQTSTCSNMADKTPTSLTSHSLFPSGGDGFDLDQLSGPFSFAPALVPTSSSPVVQPSGGNANVEIDLNPGVTLIIQ